MAAKSKSIMFTRSLTWRFWLVTGYLAIAAVFIACSIALVYTPLNDEVTKQQTQTLIQTAQADANALEKVDDAQAFVDDACKDTDLRITIISESGDVIADSELDSTTLENHLYREEVSGALDEGVGTAQRTSVSDKIERLYIAIPATFQGDTVVLRVSEAATVVDMIANPSRITIALLIAFTCIVVVLIALISLKQTAMPFRKLDQVKTDFVANASHELKTPVAGIRLLSEAIQDAADAGDTNALQLFVGRLENEAERLQRLVIDLLDLSRLESRPASTANSRVDAHSALMTSYLAHKNEATDKGLDLKLIDNSKPDDDCYAAMEPADASLVFDNLIENAIMYTDSGSITVSFTPHVKQVEVSVADTGIGIPQADQTRIFERFYRVDKARSRAVGGTGLGLSLVRHAVERANGTIKLKSDVGEGSEFRVLLPRLKNR